MIMTDVILKIEDSVLHAYQEALASSSRVFSNFLKQKPSGAVRTPIIHYFISY